MNNNFKDQASYASTADEAPKDIISSVATLLLAASVADGAPSRQELTRIITLMAREFMLSRNKAVAITKSALNDFVSVPELKEIDNACHSLVTYLTKSQREYILSLLQEVLTVDGVYEDGERLFFELMSSSLKGLDKSSTSQFQDSQ